MNMHLYSSVCWLLRSTTNSAITQRCSTNASRVGIFTRTYTSYSTRAYSSTTTIDEKPQPRKTAIITGASGGIGSAIAHRFAKEGLSTILIGRDLSKLETVLRGLDTSRTPTSASRQHRIEVGDVGSEDFWTTLSKNLKSNNEACAVLVNAAGLTHASLLVRTQSATIDHILNTNLTGTILGCKTALKGMLPRKEGVIVNVASLLAVRGGKGASVYAASKAGMLGLTRALVAETAGTGIRINCILPGYISTSMTSSSQGFSDAYRAELAESIPAKRFGTAEEVAHAAWFLVRNEYANNCTLNLDGGLSAV